MAKPALGRGLGALLGGVPAGKPLPVQPTTLVGQAAEPGERIQFIGLDRLRACPLQPRKEFAPEALEELAESIRSQGIIQPLIVRDRGEHFELIAGERRWRAAQIVGLNEVPVIVRHADDRAVLELALIENLQRENLNPLEEAHGYAELIEQFGLRQEDVAVKVGRSRAVVTNALRLLKLDPEIQAFIRDGRLSVGHAKVILGLEGAAQQKLASERIIKGGLNVRQTEELVSLLHQQQPMAMPAPGAKQHPIIRDAHVLDLESKLRERFGTKVHLRYRQGKGALEIRFYSDDELERVLQLAGIKLD